MNVKEILERSHLAIQIYDYKCTLTPIKDGELLEDDLIVFEGITAEKEAFIFAANVLKGLGFVAYKTYTNMNIVFLEGVQDDQLPEERIKERPKSSDNTSNSDPQYDWERNAVRIITTVFSIIFVLTMSFGIGVFIRENIVIAIFCTVCLIFYLIMLVQGIKNGGLNN